MARTRSTPQRFQKRLAVALVVTVLSFVVFVGRLVQVQVVEARELRKEARSQQERTLTLPASRGAILDRHLDPIVTTIPADRRGTKEAHRVYPHGNLAAHIVGMVGADGQGLEGVELVFDEYLKGEAGSRVVGANARGHRFTTPGGRIRAPKDGADVVLTIDVALQSVLERELQRTVERSGARGATAILMDPTTGDIVAMGSYPSYSPGSREMTNRRNRAATDIMEPGSTFKLVTLAASLEEGLVNPETLIRSTMELELAGNQKLRDKEDFGWVTVAETMTKSVNTATAQLARQLGAPGLYEYSRAFGFGCVTGIELPGEVSGILRRPAHWSGRSLETISIGQEVAITPLQLVAAYGAIANRGVLMKPRLVSAIREPGGKSIRRFRNQTVRRVVSEQTADRVTAILTAVVDQGTGEAAQVPGITVAGKTGTAQRVDRKTGRYARDKHVASFVGFLPAEDPWLVGAVIVDRPRGVGYGGQVAAPCFRRIVEGALLLSPEPSLLVRPTRDDARGDA